MRGVKPFEKWGINLECVKAAPLLQSLVMGICTAIAQTYGLTVVVYGLIAGYFYNLDDRICVMEEERWNKVIHYKLLAFFLSLMVTFVIGDKLNQIKHCGLNEIIYRLKIKHIGRVPNIALWMLPIGQSINYYVCFLAVIGSYFIIFAANQGIFSFNVCVSFGFFTDFINLKR